MWKCLADIGWLCLLDERKYKMKLVPAREPAFFRVPLWQSARKGGLPQKVWKDLTDSPSIFYEAQLAYGCSYRAYGPNCFLEKECRESLSFIHMLPLMIRI